MRGFGSPSTMAGKLLILWADSLSFPRKVPVFSFVSFLPPFCFVMATWSWAPNSTSQSDAGCLAWIQNTVLAERGMHRHCKHQRSSGSAFCHLQMSGHAGNLEGKQLVASEMSPFMKPMPWVLGRPVKELNNHKQGEKLEWPGSSVPGGDGAGNVTSVGDISISVPVVHILS